MNDLNVKTGSYMNIDGAEKNFGFFTSLNAYRKLLFVNSLSDALIGDNYNYAIYDLMFDYYIARIFTDIDFKYIDEINSKENSAEELLDEIEKVVDETTIVDIVKLNMEDGVLEELQKAVELNIAYRTGIKIDPIADALASLLRTVEKSFKGVDINEMTSAAKALGEISDELTMDKLIETYGKSDLFKKLVVGGKRNDDYKVIKGKKNNEVNKTDEE